MSISQIKDKGGKKKHYELVHVMRKNLLKDSVFLFVSHGRMISPENEKKTRPTLIYDIFGPYIYQISPNKFL